MWSWPTLTLVVVAASAVGLLWAYVNWQELSAVSLSDAAS